LDIVGSLKIRPTWNNSENLEALHISATDTQSGPDTTLIDAKVGGTSKFKVDKDGNITTAGSLTVAGSTTTINSTDLSIADKTIIIANGASNASAANDSGIQLGTTNLSFKYDNANTRWNLPNAGLNIGGPYRIDGTEVLSSNSLGNNITFSSLTSLGNLGNLTVTGSSSIASVSENLQVRGANESGTQQYNYGQNSVFYHPSVSGNIVVNLQNMPTDASKALAVVMIVAQGSTARTIASGSNAFGINGISYTVKWANGVSPTPNTNQNDVFSFTLVNISTTSTPNWVVYGTLGTFN
jgi:hypothetical protein